MAVVASQSKLPLPPLPAPPAGVADPATFYQKAFLLPYLDPSSPSYYGNAYTPQYKAARARAEAGLAGYGGFSFGVDDPNTPQDESLTLSQDPNAALGEKQVAAVHGEQAAANARGMLNSSFTNRNIGASLGRLTEQARAIVNQYAADLGQIGQAESKQGFDLYSGLGELYGRDALYAAQNPPAQPTVSPPYIDPNVSVNSPLGMMQNASAFKQIDQTIAPAPVAKELGPWTAKPNLPVGQYSVYQRGGKWYAKRLT